MANFFNDGAFSVSFGKQRSSEDNTLELERRARKLFSNSVHAETDVELMSIHLMMYQEDDFNLILPNSLRVSLSIAFEECLYESGVFLRQAELEELSENQRQSYRERLKASIHVHEHWEASFPVISEIMEAAFSHVFGRLERDATSLLTESPLLYDGPSLRLIDLVSDPAEMVNRIMRAFFTEEGRAGKLFEPLDMTLRANILRASGRDASEPTKPRDIVWPVDYRVDDPGEFASQYLRQTPFEPLLLTRIPVTIPAQTRFEHMHIVGGSGHGKTQALSSFILDDLNAAVEEKRSVVVIDSQGDLISSLLSLSVVADSPLSERTVIVDPTDINHPIALNPFSLPEHRMEDYSAQDRERVLFSAIDLFEHFFAELLGAELTSQQGATFKYLLRLLMEIPYATLMTFRDLLDNPNDYIDHMERLTGAARLFFQREFLQGNYKQTRTQISKRIWQVLSNPVFERLFSSSENKLDWYTALQDGSLILVNTAKDYLKTENSALFGKFIMSQLTQGILERAVVPSSKRTPCFVYIDEAQEYVDPSVDLLLSQGRKYACGVTLAHQYLDQLSTSQRSSFLSNTSIKLAGGVNRKDAQTLAGETHSTTEFLTSMEKSISHTEFALAIRNQIKRAVPLTIPLGILSRADKATKAQSKALQSLSQSKYGQAERPPESHTPFAKPTARPESPAPISSERPQSPPSPPPAGDEIIAPPELSEAASPEEARSEPTEPKSIPRPKRESPASEPKTERDHVYLQNLIKELAQKAGARASLEAPSGDGRIDVLIEKGAHSIAVEIAITTSAGHELGNVQKCLAHDVSEVWLVTKGNRRLSNLKKTISAELSAEERQKLRFYLPEDLQGVLAGLADIPVKEHTHRNYRVKVKTSGTDANNEKRQAIAKVIAQSMSKKE